MNSRCYRNIFSAIFIFLLFAAEIFSGQNAFFPEWKTDLSNFSNITSSGKGHLKNTVLIESTYRTNAYDIEQVKHSENIENGIVRIGQRTRPQRQNRRKGQIPSPFLKNICVAFLSWISALYFLFCFGISITYSWWFILKYIHHKDGEKIWSFLSADIRCRNV